MTTVSYISPSKITPTQKSSKLDFKRQSLVKVFLNKISFGSLFQPQLKISNAISIRNFKLRKLIVYPKASPAEYNSTLEGLRVFVKKLTILSIDCIQKKYIKPALDRFDADSEKIPKVLKVLAAEFISYGEQSSKTIFEIFDAFNFSASAIEKLQNAMSWALKDLNLNNEDQKQNFINEFKDLILAKVNQEPKNTLKTDAVKYHIDKIVCWIVDSDHKELPVSFKEENVNIIFQKALLVLSEMKIDLYTNKINSILQNDLPSIIRKSIKDNAIKITDILSERVAQVFNKLGSDDAQFAIIFDKLIEIIAIHAKSLTFCYEQAEIAEKKHLDLEKKARLIVEQSKITQEDIVLYQQGIRKKNPNIESYIKAMQYLEDLETFGGIQGIKKRTLLKTFLAETGNSAPSITSDKLISEISNHLFNILIPYADEKKFFETLLSTIDMPQAYHDLLDEAKNTVRMISSEKDYKKIEKFLVNLKKGGEKLGLILLEILKLGMSEAVQSCLNHLSKPEELNIIFSESILPAVTEAMIFAYADDLICDHIKDLSQHLLEKSEFASKLIKISKTKIKNIDKESLKKAILQRFDDLKDLIQSLGIDTTNNLLVTKVIQEYYIHNYNKYPADDFLRLNSKKIASRLKDKVSIDIILQDLQEIALRAKDEYSYLYPEVKSSFYNSVNSRLEQIKQHVFAKSLKDEKSIRNELLKFLDENSIAGTNNPFFSDLITCILKTGQFGSAFPTLFNFSSVRNSVSRLVTQSLSNIRNYSYQPILNSVLHVLEKKCLDEKLIDDWISQKPSVTSLDEQISVIMNKITQVEDQIRQDSNNDFKIQLGSKLSTLKQSLEEKNALRKIVAEREEKHKESIEKSKIHLPEEIKKISKISYELLVYKVSRKSTLGKIFIKHVVGKNHKSIKNALFTLFNQVFTHQSFNEHLLSNLFLTKVQGLDWSANKIGTGSPFLLDPNNFSGKTNEIQVTRQTLKTDFKKLPSKKKIIKKSLLRRIYHFAVILFKKFINLFKSNKRFNKSQIKQVTALHDLLNKKKRLKINDNSTQSIHNVTSSEDTFDAIEGCNSENDLVLSADDTNDPLNKSLQNIHAFAIEFMKKIGDEIFTQKIEPLTKFVSLSADKLPYYVKILLDSITRLTEPTTKSILKIIIQNGFKFDLTDTQKGFLDILISEIKNNNEDINQLNDLRGRFDKLNQKIQLSKDFYDRYCCVMTDWLKQNYSSKVEIKSLKIFVEEYRSHNNFNFDDENVAIFYACAIEWLVHNKIQNSALRLQNFLENDLTTLVKTFLDSNLKQIAETLFFRIAKLINQIDNTEYKEFFDSCFKDIYTQLKNIHTASKNVEKNNKDLPNKTSAVAVELSSNYEKYEISHLSIPLFKKPTLSENIDPESYKNAYLTEIYNNMVNRIMDLILPVHQIPVNGQVVKDDAITILLENVIIDAEVKNTFLDLLQFVKSVIPEKYAGKMDSIVKKAKQQLFSFVTNIIRAKLSKMLATLLKENFQTLIDNDSRKEVISKAFPSIEYHLTVNFASLFIKTNINKYFKALIETPLTDGGLLRLQESLKKELKPKFNKSWNALKIEDQLTDKLFDPILKNIVGYFLYPYFHDRKHKNVLKTVQENLILLYRDEDDEDAFNVIFETIFIDVKKTFNFGWEDNAYQDTIRENFKHYLKEAISPLLYQLHLACKSDQLTLDLLDRVLSEHIQGINDKKRDYSNFIGEMIQPVNFGTFLNWAVKAIVNSNYLQNKVTDGLIPSLHPIRGSITKVLDLLAYLFRAKWIDNKDAIADLFKAKSLKSLKSVQDLLGESKSEIIKLKSSLDVKSDQYPQKIHKYDKRIQELNEKSQTNSLAIKNIEEQQQLADRYELIDVKFEKGFNMLAHLLYDFCANSAPTGYSVVMGSDPSFIREKILKQFYNDFFMDTNSNLSLLINMTDKILSILEIKNQALK